LVALALMEQDGRRRLPLCGKSQPASAAAAADPGDTGRGLALELLLRIWQRSDDGPLRRAAGPDSLLLVELPLEVMSEQLPVLKANGISTGATAALLDGLKTLVQRGWRIHFAKYEPVSFPSWP
ncbi:MAG: hypothetical protein ACK516_06215, partial [Cyanobium sp.]